MPNCDKAICAQVYSIPALDALSIPPAVAWVNPNTGFHDIHLITTCNVTSIGCSSPGCSRSGKRGPFGVMYSPTCSV